MNVKTHERELLKPEIAISTDITFKWELTKLISEGTKS